jgi:molecular chaperone GrpE
MAVNETGNETNENTNAENVQTEENQLEEAQAEPAPSAEATIAELEAALAESKASVLYIKAEGENIRRRAMDDIDKARKFALEKFSNELLAVKDSLDAALGVANADAESYKNGVEITAKQLSGVFEKFNIVEMNPLNEKFDPHKHQAISMLENSGEPNTVISVLQKGYTLNDRVLRPALVTVAK